MTAGGLTGGLNHARTQGARPRPPPGARPSLLPVAPGDGEATRSGRAPNLACLLIASPPLCEPPALPPPPPPSLRPPASAPQPPPHGPARPGCRIRRAMVLEQALPPGPTLNAVARAHFVLPAARPAAHAAPPSARAGQGRLGAGNPGYAAAGNPGHRHLAVRPKRLQAAGRGGDARCHRAGFHHRRPAVGGVLFRAHRGRRPRGAGQPARRRPAGHGAGRAHRGRPQPARAAGWPHRDRPPGGDRAGRAAGDRRQGRAQLALHPAKASRRLGQPRPGQPPPRQPHPRHPRPPPPPAPTPSSASNASRPPKPRRRRRSNGSPTSRWTAAGCRSPARPGR